MIAICAHPSRRQHVEEVLAPALGFPPIAWDTEGIGSNRNHARAWRLAAQEGDWAGVVEDDAVPVEGCLDNLPVMLPHSPSKLISAYCGSGRPEKHQGALETVLARNPQWIISTDLLHHVAVFTTPELALTFADLLDSSPWPCDSAIGFWARKHRLPVSYCIPSLFDHLDPEPLITDRHVTEVPRHAWTTGTRDWTSNRVEFLNKQAEVMYGGQSFGLGSPM